LAAVTFVPSAAQVALQPLPKLCHERGNRKPRVHPLTGSVPVLVMSMVPT
jgi:hypothetical protein